MFSGEATTPSVHESEENKAVHSNSVENKSDIQPIKVSSAGSLGVLVLIATVLALIGTGVLFLYKTSRVSRLDTEKKRFSEFSNQLNSDELKTLADDLQEVTEGQRSLKDALDGKIYWSKFWDKLSKATPLAVYYNSMAIDSNGVVSISGSADSLTSIAKLMVSLQNSSKLFNDVKLGNTSVKNTADKTVIAFSVTFRVNPSELTK